MIWRGLNIRESEMAKINQETALDSFQFDGSPTHLLSNDGIFTINTIQNLSLDIDPLTNESNLDGVGRTQWVTVEAPKEKFSGAWFVKV